MFKRLLTVFVVVAAAAGVLSVAWAQFFTTHQATGQVSSASAPVDVSYICEPAGTTTSPICPTDDSGADEFIFETNEQTLPGTVRWWKLRIRNVHTDPWDILSISSSWSKISDPSGICNQFPVDVRYNGPSQTTIMGSGQGPGITILGTGPNTSPGNVYREPVEGIYYSSITNDDHTPVAGSAAFLGLDSGTRSIHLAPGGYEDLLLGIGLPTTTPPQCVNNVWAVTLNFDVQIHQP